MLVWIYNDVFKYNNIICGDKMSRIEPTQRLLLAFGTSNNQMDILRKFILDEYKERGMVDIPINTVIDYIDCIMDMNNNAIQELNEGTYEFKI